MTVKYFTGSNNVVGGGKNQTSDTGLTTLGFAETHPVNNADGVDVKNQGSAQSKYVVITQKVLSKTTDSFGKSFANNNGCLTVNKARVDKLKHKHSLHHMLKYRKHLKKMMTATGFAANGSSKGERNMYNGKGKGDTTAKNYKGAATDYPLYPLSETK